MLTKREKTKKKLEIVKLEIITVTAIQLGRLGHRKLINMKLKFET